MKLLIILFLQLQLIAQSSVIDSITFVPDSSIAPNTYTITHPFDPSPVSIGPITVDSNQWNGTLNRPTQPNSTAAYYGFVPYVVDTVSPAINPNWGSAARGLIVSNIIWQHAPSKGAKLRVEARAVTIDTHYIKTRFQAHLGFRVVLHNSTQPSIALINFNCRSGEDVNPSLHRIVTYENQQSYIRLTFDSTNETYTYYPTFGPNEYYHKSKEWEVQLPVGDTILFVETFMDITIDTTSHNSHREYGWENLEWVMTIIDDEPTSPISVQPFSTPCAEIWTERGYHYNNKDLRITGDLFEQYLLPNQSRNDYLVYLLMDPSIYWTPLATNPLWNCELNINPTTALLVLPVSWNNMYDNSVTFDVDMLNGSYNFFMQYLFIDFSGRGNHLTSHIMETYN